MVLFSKGLLSEVPLTKVKFTIIISITVTAGVVDGGSSTTIGVIILAVVVILLVAVIVVLLAAYVWRRKTKYGAFNIM